jgi:UDPglucose 6-dehydrogenase
MNVTIIGTGFVGVVSAAVYASFGNKVYGLDVDQAKVDSLKQGIVPFYEPGLSELLKEQQATGNLFFTTDYAEAIAEADVIMIAVGTPSAPDGQADLKYVFMAAESLAPHLKAGAIVVVKSTVPPGTLLEVEKRIKTKTQTPFFTASVPEFLREGSAVEDTLHPDRVVLGATDESVFAKLEELHAPLNATFIKVKPESAQMAKYSANAYLATRITFINQIADLCERNGADVQEVISAISPDKRIGSHYWYPGFGYGGSCFPKDVKELAAYSRFVGEGNNLFNKLTELNEERIPKLLEEMSEKIGGWQGKTVAVLGLSFKPNTDDMREAPSLKVVPILVSKGATVKGFDPKAQMPTTALDADSSHAFQQVTTIEEAAKDADVVMALVEWQDIVKFDFAPLTKKNPAWFVDVRNQFDPAKVTNWGYHYLGTGR